MHVFSPLKLWTSVPYDSFFKMYTAEYITTLPILPGIVAKLVMFLQLEKYVDDFMF